MMKYVEKSSTGTHSVGYTYDSLNNLTALVETIGTTERKISYAYDGDNRPTSITAGNSALSYAYDAYGRVSTLTTKHDGNAFTTKTYAYKLNSNGTPTNQVSGVTVKIGSNSRTYTYTYDKNGNITSINDGTYVTGYAYDSANQLIREDNQEAGTTTVWTYDAAGNIQTRTVHPYTTGAVGEGTQTNYFYTDTQWGDLLKSYNKRPIARDELGNPTNDFIWKYTWQHGRQLASMTKLDGSTQWNYTYNADGLRTQRTGFVTDPTTGVTANRTYNYTYTGDKLTHMTVDGHTMYFTYDASGTPLNLVYDGLKFYYITNLQGDVISIVDGNGTEFVRYSYDAWGKIIKVEGSATNLRYYNPLRYRGYVYDEETELYYLQSRYYNPEMGRFISADRYISTGTGLIGYNMFAYCSNNPVMMYDPTGEIGLGAAIILGLLCLAVIVVIPSSGHQEPTEQQIREAEDAADSADYWVTQTEDGEPTVNVNLPTEEVDNAVDPIAKSHFYKKVRQNTEEIANQNGIGTENLMSVWHIRWEFELHVVASWFNIENADPAELNIDETLISMFKRIDW